ncbi:hypothetical protein BK004_02350 [bacterium CG10_46_32]|nr:MAG: hypothetical protein BK004_02350 [bacterium CG10_46_32]PIR56155.1 MAG: hypothetical protein COU73_02370 [Parcubacteria group bacterium CG10_big_fil_rev_8_21_14_0_10_46_32]
MERVYCYVDETGQDTKGVLFSVCCTVVVSYNAKEKLEQLMYAIERVTKKKSKWQKTDHQVKLRFLDALLAHRTQLKDHIFIEHFFNIDDYSQATVEAVSASIKTAHHQTKQAIVYIDGLSKHTIKTVAVALRHRGITTEKVKGLKDEQNALIRLSDAIAGFVRDYLEAQVYAKRYFHRLVGARIITEI